MIKKRCCNSALNDALQGQHLQILVSFGWKRPYRYTIKPQHIYYHLIGQEILVMKKDGAL